MGKAIRVLIVDDSTFLRHSLTRRLQAIEDIVVAGSAVDGLDALARVGELRPDVVILDVEMPRMDGLEALQRIMAERPTPVVMLSAHTQRGARTTIQALMRGAVDFVAKPGTVEDIRSVVEELVAKVRLAAGTATTTIPRPPATAQDPAGTAKAGPGRFHRGDRLIVIGASTGGPRALQEVLSNLPADLPAALAVVQHMPAGFTQALAQRLNQESALTVQEAASGQLVERGLVLLAPGDLHLCFANDGHVVLDNGPRRNHVRPSVDVTMESAAHVYKRAAIGVVLTGMGSDGTAGAASIKAAGGQVIAEHESTSTIYGMPCSVVEAGLADRVVPLPQVAGVLVEMVKDG